MNLFQQSLVMDNLSICGGAFLKSFFTERIRTRAQTQFELEFKNLIFQELWFRL